MEKKNSNLTFGVDIDEVLRSLVPGMVRLYNEEFGENMSIDDVKDFVVDNSFPKIMERTGESASKWFFQDHGKELFLESDEIKGSKEALDTLRKYGKVILTGDKFVQTKEGAEEIKEHFNFDTNDRYALVDMEAAAIAQVCFANNVPLSVFKVVSDIVDKYESADDHDKEYEKFKKDFK